MLRLNLCLLGLSLCFGSRLHCLTVDFGTARFITGTRLQQRLGRDLIDHITRFNVTILQNSGIVIHIDEDAQGRPTRRNLLHASRISRKGFSSTRLLRAGAKQGSILKCRIYSFNHDPNRFNKCTFKNAPLTRPLSPME